MSEVSRSHEGRASIEPWMVETASELVRVVKAANYMGVASFEGNGRLVRVIRGVAGINVEFDFAGGSR